MGDHKLRTTDREYDQYSQPTTSAQGDLNPTGPRPLKDVPHLVRWVRSLEADRRIDGVADPLHRLAHALVAEPRRRDLLHGRWLGHAAHPLLTDLPLGAWTSSLVLDLVGGQRSRVASRRLVAFGVLTALPTALTGVAEWTQTTGRERRVGFVHGAGNVVALGLYTTSLVARYRGREALGVLTGVAGGGVAAATGYLGGHLTLARKVSTRHPVFDEQLGTSD